jgi:hypothetical protein
MPLKTNNGVSISPLAVNVTATVTLIVEPVDVHTLMLLARHAVNVVLGTMKKLVFDPY